LKRIILWSATSTSHKVFDKWTGVTGSATSGWDTLESVVNVTRLPFFFLPILLNY